MLLILTIGMRWDPANLNGGLMGWQIAAIIIDIAFAGLIVFLELRSIKRYKKDAALEPVVSVSTEGGAE